MKDALKTYIMDEILSGDGVDSVDVEDDLLASGMLDSISMIRLVAFVEEAFDVQVKPEDVTIDNFRSIVTIVRYLEKRKGQDG